MQPARALALLALLSLSHIRAAGSCKQCIAADTDELIFLLQVGGSKRSAQPVTEAYPNTHPNAYPNASRAYSRRYAPLRPTRPPPPKSAAELAGVKEDSAGDRRALLQELQVNSVALLAFAGLFTLLRLWHPYVYSYNALSGAAPQKPPQGPLGWLQAMLATSTDEAIASVGLDNAQLLEFFDMCMKILGTIGVPMVAVMCPLHFYLGGDAALARADNLSRIGMGNVVNGHPWLYHVHACVVWGVVLVVQHFVYEAQRKFLSRRFAWLKSLPPPRATTVLVEGIPEAHRSDEQLRGFFAGIFSPERVKEARVVKHLEELESLLASRDRAQERLQQAEEAWERGERSPQSRPTFHQHLVGRKIDSIDYYRDLVTSLTEQIAAERRRISEEAQRVGGINSSSGFVTFTGQTEAELAKSLVYSPDDSEWRVSVPPAPGTVIWSDLRQDTEVRWLKAVVGQLALIGLYVGFTPVCLLVTNLSYTIEVTGPLQPYWEAYAPSLGLMLFLSFLPSTFLLIFRVCFTLRAEGWAQHKLQISYFWFQVAFVILVSAIGNDIVGLVHNIAREPLSFVLLLADQLPSATHFYMNYLVMQWPTHATAALRYPELGKYLAARAVWSEEASRALAEPEDQSYHGIGSRSARFTIVMLIGIVYSTLSPTIALLAFVNLALARLFTGYLIIFAETKKPDLGGAFWVTKLKHVLLGTILYCVLMAGVLATRGPNLVPAAAAAGAAAYAVSSYQHFIHEFQWEKLPVTEVPKSGDQVSDESVDCYVQPELRST